jgi:hypothetical protein
MYFGTELKFSNRRRHISLNKLASEQNCDWQPQEGNFLARFNIRVITKDG